MRLHVLSDLHLEQASFTPPRTDAEVVVLAGDVAPGTAGVSWAAHAFGSVPVLYVAGNHEYYGHELPGLLDELRAAAAGSGVRVLERDEAVIDGVRFLGCALWTAFDSAGEARRDSTMRFAERVVNDYRLIRSSATGTPLRAAETLALHQQSRAWLAERLAVAHDGPTVVLTHHVPIVRRRSESLVVQALGGSVVSDLTELIGDERQALWLYGHSHRAADFEHGGTRLLSNPRGYPREAGSGFDPALVVEI